MKKLVVLLLLSFNIYSQQAAETILAFDNKYGKRISIDSAINHIRELKRQSSIQYGEAVDFYYLKIASTGKNKWIEKLEEFSLDPDCLAKNRTKINAQIERIRTLQVGEKAPNIQTQNFDLYQHKTNKRNLLLLFYSPSCFHCTELIIDLIPYAEKNNLHVIALQIDDEMNPWNFPIHWTSLKVDEKTRKDFGVFSTPSLYLLNSTSKRISAIPENLSELKESEHLF